MFSTSILETRANHGYGPKPIPVERDFQINEFLDAIMAATPPERARLTTSLDASHAPVLRAFAERMASFAVRQGSAEPLRRGLLALALGGAADDEREMIMVLPLIYRSAELIDADPDSLFAEASNTVGRNTASEAIQDFPARTFEDRSLAAFGFIEGHDVDGFRYLRTW
jgi:hypothetical protein